MIPTAEDFLKAKDYNITDDGELYDGLLTNNVIKDMIEFAQLHVEAALTQAKDMEVDGCGCGEAFLITEHINSLIKTYPKELIK